MRADSGKYKLLLTNSSGTCESFAEVTVLDKPTAPRGPLKTDEVRSDHMVISWKKPEDSGGMPIT